MAKIQIFNIEFLCSCSFRVDLSKGEHSIALLAALSLGRKNLHHFLFAVMRT